MDEKMQEEFCAWLPDTHCYPDAVEVAEWVIAYLRTQQRPVGRITEIKPENRKAVLAVKWETGDVNIGDEIYTHPSYKALRGPDVIDVINRLVAMSDALAVGDEKKAQSIMRATLAILLVAQKSEQQ